MKSLAKNSLYNILYQFLNLFFPLLSSMYVARIIMEDGIGKVAYAQSIAAYFVAIAVSGFPVYGIREIAKARADNRLCSCVFWELFIINAVVTVIASAFYVVTIISIDHFHENLMLFICTGISIWINFANIDWFYQGKEEYGYITTRNIVVKVITFIGLFLLVKTKDDYINYAFLSSFGLACNYFFNLYHVKNMYLLKLGLQN